MIFNCVYYYYYSTIQFLGYLFDIICSFYVIKYLFIGYIDLSKKRVSPDEVKKVEERWFKSKSVHSIMRHVCKLSNYSVEQLYIKFGWPITKLTNTKNGKKFEHIYDGFKFAIQYVFIF